MRYQGLSFGVVAVSATLGGFAVACGGGASTGGDDPGSGASAAAVRAESPLEATGATTRHFSPRALSRLKSRGIGYAGFTVCATGKSCAGENAGSEFFAQWNPDEPDAGAACTTSIVGACEVETCPSGGSPPPGVKAGTITIGGGTLGSLALTATKAEDFEYFWDQAGVAFSTGDTLTVSGSGATVPAFATQSLVTPAMITLAKPAAEKSGAYKISTSSPLHVAWSGGTSGAQVFLQGEGASSVTEDGGISVLTDTYVSCAWDASANKGTVPAEAIGALAGLKGSLAWGQQVVDAFSAGAYPTDYVIDIAAEAPATFE
jgi:hypothetical protein